MLKEERFFLLLGAVYFVSFLIHEISYGLSK